MQRRIHGLFSVRSKTKQKRGIFSASFALKRNGIFHVQNEKGNEGKQNKNEHKVGKQKKGKSWYEYQRERDQILAQYINSRS
jgi:hypothetical protein